MLKSTEIYVSCGILVSLYALWMFRSRSALKDIPGPRGLPLLGNLLDWPSEFQGQQVEVWKKMFGQYTDPSKFLARTYYNLTLTGPMVKLSVFGKTAIFLGSGRSISELFATRSSRFSDRPKLTFSGELYVPHATL
jgi:hypothetical protein